MNEGERRERCCRVASYNIHQCVGIDRRLDIDRVAAVIRQMDADIVGLQEVNAPFGEDRATMQQSVPMISMRWRIPSAR